jgi:hypothetical protein
MLRILTALALLLPLGGCSWGPWQANNASQNVDINLGALGTGQPVFTPASGGDDYRSRR